MTRKTPMPCPFCAEMPIFVEDHTGLHEVRCDNDDCEIRVETLSCASREDAVAAWNRRQGDPR